jgi:hypothetical protein
VILGFEFQVPQPERNEEQSFVFNFENIQSNECVNRLTNVKQKTMQTPNQEQYYATQSQNDTQHQMPG